MRCCVLVSIHDSPVAKAAEIIGGPSGNRVKTGFRAARRARAAFTLLIAMLAAVSCSDSWRVKAVIDGDTIVVSRGLITERVRLKGVDAPELANPDRGILADEYYARESGRCLSRLLGGEPVRLEYDPPGGVPERDKYGRLLAYVHAGDVLVNAELISRGCARAYRRFPHSRLDEFVALEAEARSSGRGMWKIPRRGSAK